MVESEGLDLKYGSSALAKISDTRLTKMVANLMRENPQASQADIVKLSRAEIIEDPESVDACIAATIIRLYTNIKRLECPELGDEPGDEPAPPPKPRPRCPPTEEEKAEEAKFIEETKTKIYSIMLEKVRLATTGKLLLDDTTTFADCAKEGGAYARLAKKGKLKEIVSKKLTKAQILAELEKK